MYLTKIQNNFVSHGKNTYFCAQKGMPKECFIGLGSNENTASNMISAQKDLLRFFPDIRFSSLLQTRPIGFCSPNPFFNMTAVCTTYICVAPEGFGLGTENSMLVAGAAVLVALVWFGIWYSQKAKKALKA